MEKKALDISSNAANVYRLLNPGLVMLISVGDGSRDNLFTVTWNMPIRKTPGMVAILAGKRHYSYSFIEETGEFGINVPDASMADAVFGCGTTSGADGKDKFVRFGLTREESQKIKAPVVKEAIAHLECRVCQVVDMGASSLLIAQILAAAADPRYFTNGEWKFDDGLQLLHHLGDDHFSISEHAITAKKI